MFKLYVALATVFLILFAASFTQAAINPACAAATNCTACAAAGPECQWCASGTPSCKDYIDEASSCTDNKWFTRDTCDSCPSKTVIQLGWSASNPIPQPTASITFNTATSKFDFTVNAEYLGENYVWVIDFQSWDRTVRSLNTPNNCENRLASSYAGKTFPQYFSSAVFANIPGTLNSTDFLAYGPTNNWAINATSCSKVTYKRSFTFSDLFGCKGNDNTHLISATTVDNSMIYQGALKVTAVKPVDVNNAGAGYSSVEFSYPFKFSLDTYVNNVESINNNGFAFTANVIGLRLVNGKMELTVETMLKSEVTQKNFIRQPTATNVAQPGAIVEGPLTISSGVPCSNYVNGQCKQQFTFTTTNVATAYSGTYEFTWYVTECSISTSTTCVDTTRPVLGRLQIQQNVVDVVNEDTSIRSKVTLHSQDYTLQTNGPFNAGEEIWIKDALQLADADVDKFNINIKNAWICVASDPTFVPIYDPANSKYGCKQPYGAIRSEGIVQLVASGVPTNAVKIQQAFATRFIAPKSHAALPYLSTIGLRFSAQPLAAVDAIYYIHVESEITSIEQTRSGVARKIQMNAIVSHMSQGAYLKAAMPTVASGASSVSFGILAMVAVVVQLVLLL